MKFESFCHLLFCYASSTSHPDYLPPSRTLSLLHNYQHCSLESTLFPLLQTPQRYSEDCRVGKIGGSGQIHVECVQGGWWRWTFEMWIWIRLRIPVVRSVKVCDFCKLSLPRLDFILIFDEWEIQDISPEPIALQIIFGKECWFLTPKFQVEHLLRLFDQGYIAEVAEEIIHLHVCKIDGWCKLQIAALLIDWNILFVLARFISACLLLLTTQQPINIALNVNINIVFSCLRHLLGTVRGFDKRYILLWRAMIKWSCRNWRWKHVVVTTVTRVVGVIDRKLAGLIGIIYILRNKRLQTDSFSCLVF